MRVLIINGKKISTVQIKMLCKPHGYKVNQAHEVSLREGALGHLLAEHHPKDVALVKAC
jgi:hypothetical protein